MTKKEFKKMCKSEKDISYKLMLSGAITSTIGLLIVLVSLFAIIEFSHQITGYTIGGFIAIIGIILDLLGEVILARKYKEYSK